MRRVPRRGILMHRRSLVAAALAGLAILVLASSALAAPHTTVSRTIQDCDEDNLLEFAPGEEHYDVRFGQEPPSDPPGRGCPRDDSGDTPRLPNTASVLNFL